MGGVCVAKSKGNEISDNESKILDPEEEKT